MKNIKFALIALALIGCNPPESTDEVYDISICSPDTIQVLSDCADPTSVSCECTTPDSFHVKVQGAVNSNVRCVSHCAPYGGQ